MKPNFLIEIDSACWQHRKKIRIVMKDLGPKNNLFNIDTLDCSYIPSHRIDWLRWCPGFVC